MLTLESKRAYYTFHVLLTEFALVTLTHIGGVHGTLYTYTYVHGIFSYTRAYIIATFETQFYRTTCLILMKLIHISEGVV